MDRTRKVKEKDLPVPAGREARFMAARVRASRGLEEAYEATLDPRERTQEVHEVLGSQDPI